MTAESFTRWTCDECGAVHEGRELAPAWIDTGTVTLCAECDQGAEGEIRLLLLRLAAAELETHEWRARWRSVRAEVDRLTAELARVRADQRRDTESGRRRPAA